MHLLPKKIKTMEKGAMGLKFLKNYIVVQNAKIIYNSIADENKQVTSTKNKNTQCNRTPKSLFNITKMLTLELQIIFSDLKEQQLEAMRGNPPTLLHNLQGKETNTLVFYNSS